MMTLWFVFLWIFLRESIPIMANTSTPPTTLFKHLMVLVSGSGREFDETWSLNSLNDPHNNRSDLDLFELLAGGEFKATIDPSWGNLEWIRIAFTNSFGDELADMEFHVPNINITGQTTWVTNTFDNMWPLNIHSEDAGITARDGQRELLLQNLTTDETWAGILHDFNSSSDPVFVLAPYISESFTYGSGETSTSMGCKPVNNLSVLYQYSSVTNMTVENCYWSACRTTDYLYLGIKHGTDCYCVNIIIPDLYADLPHYCTKTCSGNPTQTCGGISTAYLSVYNTTQVNNSLDSLTEVQNATLLNVSLADTTNEVTINVDTATTWPHSYMYINGLIVNGENANTSVPVQYDIEYKYGFDGAFRPYMELNGTLWTGVTGTTYGIESLLIEELRINFQEITTSISVELIGPSGTDDNPAYITAKYLLVSGEFTPTQSTISSTSSSLPTTSAATTLSPTTSAATTLSPATSAATISSPTTADTSASSTTPTPSVTTSTLATAPISTNAPATTVTAVSAVTTTVSTSAVIYSNYSILVNGVLYCPCALTTTPAPSTPALNVTIDIDAIIAELTLDPDTLSSHTRKYSSAEDDRPSARTIGALGVIIISLVIGLIVAMDSANLKSEAVKIKKNYRYLKKRLSKRSLKIDDISTINNTDSNVNDMPEVFM